MMIISKYNIKTTLTIYRLIYEQRSARNPTAVGILRPAEDAANPAGLASQRSPGGEVDVTSEWVKPHT